MVGRNARPLTRIGGLPGMRPGRRLLVKTDPLLLSSTLFSNQSGWNARRRPSAHVGQAIQSDAVFNAQISQGRRKHWEMVLARQSLRIPWA